MVSDGYERKNSLRNWEPFDSLGVVLNLHVSELPVAVFRKAVSGTLLLTSRIKSGFNQCHR